MVQLTHITEGIRIFRRRLRINTGGPKRYKGDSAEICKKILDDCYNKKKKYFQVSAGHFQVFYCRDFGWITKSLLELGYKNKVRSTLRYALTQFRKHGHIRTTINPQGVPFDFPMYAVDSIPYLVYSLSCLNDKKLVNEFKKFLESEIDYFFDEVVDIKRGMVRRDEFFSSMKDHSKRQSSCYDNSMLYLLQQGCNKLGLFNPLKKYNYKKIIMKNFWVGDYFLDDISGAKYVAGDSNIFPFWTGAITDNTILKKVVSTLSKKGLDKPFPLCYTEGGKHRVDFVVVETLAKNYEGDVAWMHMGPLYVDIVGGVNKKLQNNYMRQYKKIIMKYGNFLEVFNKDGTPFKTFWYYSDESMSWCANYFNLLRKTNIKP